MSRLIGVIHLAALPGSPTFGGDPVRRAARAAAGAPVLIGSGATEENVAGLLEVADGAILGTALKIDGVTTNPVDPARAAAFVKAAR